MTEATLDPKTQESIDAALSSNWEKALELNLELSKKYPKDPEILNRLARSYLELGKVSKARENYNKVLKIDPYNSIAAKNIKKLANIKKKDIKNGQSGTNESMDPDIFLEEPGKTKVVNLVDIAMLSVLASLRIGDKVSLDPQRNDVVVHTAENKRLGKMESNWAEKIAKAIRAGSKFAAFIKSVQLKSRTTEPALLIFVKETERSPKLSQSIFPTAPSHFTPYVREETLDILSEKSAPSSSSDESPEEEGDSSGEESNDKELAEDDTKASSLETLAEKEVQDDQSYEED
jgi:tetratricopeptide (TPR) repeat protein